MIKGFHYGGAAKREARGPVVPCELTNSLGSGLGTEGEEMGELGTQALDWRAGSLCRWIPWRKGSARDEA